MGTTSEGLGHFSFATCDTVPYLKQHSLCYSHTDCLHGEVKPIQLNIYMVNLT